MNKSGTKPNAARSLTLVVTIIGLTFGTLGCEKPDRTEKQKAEMRNVIIGAEIYRSVKQEYPTSVSELEAFLKHEIPSVDAWEQPIRFEFSKVGVTCRSSGPDRTPETLDDLVWMTQDEGF